MKFDKKKNPKCEVGHRYEMIKYRYIMTFSFSNSFDLIIIYSSFPFLNNQHLMRFRGGNFIQLEEIPQQPSKTREKRDE